MGVKELHYVSIYEALVIKITIKQMCVHEKFLHRKNCNTTYATYVYLHIFLILFILK